MDKIRLINFRNIKDSGEIELKPLTILVGKNGSGKSSFLRLFPLLQQSFLSAKKGPLLWYRDKGVDFGDFSTTGKRLRVYTIVVFSFIRTFAPSF